ncbi:2-dehydropantoate 2-reductase [Pseudooceanicola sp. LIPI14-2-Ac024]|uniref:2-dehydropantoate 2-reductase n=1 Tax=Pseudooceanicola sp. LIPI14-2-Ac024 TaxID=3344875 RepID=UPI0035CF7CEE
MIAVLGAGAIGGFVGGMLASSGVPVTFVGRSGPPRALEGGLTVTPWGGAAREVPPNEITLTGPEGLGAAETILLCTKSADTAGAAEVIAAHAAATAVVVSLQNGLGNVETLSARLGGDRVVPGMVGFNVIRPEAHHFLQATEGEIMVGPAALRLAQQMHGAGLPATTHDNMTGVQWSKLILNLNNPLNALSGLPLRDHLMDRDWRRIGADCAAETIAVARAKGITLERMGKVEPRIVPRVLRLPTPIFRVLASAMLRIDPQARTSMAQDLAAGRPSELPWLNGKVSEAGREVGVPTPTIDAVIAMTDATFAEGASPRLTGAAARARIAGIRSPG